LKWESGINSYVRLLLQMHWYSAMRNRLPAARVCAFAITNRIEVGLWNRRLCAFAITNAIVPAPCGSGCQQGEYTRLLLQIESESACMTEDYVRLLLQMQWCRAKRKRLPAARVCAFAITNRIGVGVHDRRLCAFTIANRIEVGLWNRRLRAFAITNAMVPRHAEAAASSASMRICYYKCNRTGAMRKRLPAARVCAFAIANRIEEGVRNRRLCAFAITNAMVQRHAEAAAGRASMCVCH
jgi:hypothetical protein